MAIRLFYNYKVGVCSISVRTPLYTTVRNNLTKVRVINESLSS
jgi:hypothetical protein